MDTLLDAEAVKEGVARRDRERLQGVWNFFSGTREARLLIAGDHYTVQFKNGPIYVGTFTVDPTRKPKTIDMHVIDGPEKHKGKVSLGIYALDGNKLIWCPGDPSSGERLIAFPADDDTRHLCVIFEREKPQAPVQTPHADFTPAP